MRKAALCLSQTLMRITGIGAILFLLSPVVSNLVAIIQSKVDNGSVVAHARRTISISDRNGKDPKPPALPPDTYCCGRA
ncbi:hypothetical protein BD779DRAFT_540389 [Infundibulicybe gibba]|nr:hypothetical protein BD779DRAFT_540389 [Infundibulicybe gibba]